MLPICLCGNYGFYVLKETPGAGGRGKVGMSGGFGSQEKPWQGGKVWLCITLDYI